MIYINFVLILVVFVLAGLILNEIAELAIRLTRIERLLVEHKVLEASDYDLNKGG